MLHVSYASLNQIVLTGSHSQKNRVLSPWEDSDLGGLHMKKWWWALPITPSFPSLSPFHSLRTDYTSHYFLLPDSENIFFLKQTSILYTKTLFYFTYCHPTLTSILCVCVLKSGGKNTELLEGGYLSKADADWVYGWHVWHNHQPSCWDKEQDNYVCNPYFYSTLSWRSWLMQKGKNKERVLKNWGLIIHIGHDCGWIICINTLRNNRFSKVTGYKSHIQKLYISKKKWNYFYLNCKSIKNTKYLEVYLTKV